MHLVYGGNQDNFMLPIGRIAYQGEIVLGKIWTANPSAAYLYFMHGATEVNTDIFEALVYDN